MLGEIADKPEADGPTVGFCQNHLRKRVGDLFNPQATEAARPLTQAVLARHYDQSQNRGFMVIPPGRYAISPEFDCSRML